MDPRLAQRLIGAAVITALAVIFVPELVEQRKPPVVASANTAPPSAPDAPQHVENPALTLSNPQPALAAPPVTDSTPTIPAIPITATPIQPESPPPTAPIGSDVQRATVTTTPDEPTPTATTKSAPEKVIPLKATPETKAERSATAKATPTRHTASEKTPHRTGTVETPAPHQIKQNTSPKGIAATRHPSLTSGKTPPATPLPTTASVTPKATKPAANPKPRPLVSAAKPQTNRRPAKSIQPQPNIAMPTAPPTPAQATPTKPKPESPWDTSSIGFNQK